MAGGEYQFAAWVRTGIGARLDGAAHNVRLDLGAAGDVTIPVTPYGPGDVTGLGPGAFVRTVPAPGSIDFEPNLFPAVELAHPALPWMLSPPANAAGRVTPWLVLIVVEEQVGVTLEHDSARTLLAIETPADPARELPDLSQAWAWVHAQAVGAEGGPFDDADLLRSGGEGRARLLCPRRLAPSARYIACVVPAFAAGVAAALGMPVPPGTALAWTTSPVVPVRLPVFHAWRFTTGLGGDFASLAARLTPEVLADTVGHRPVDASTPGWSAPDVPGLVVEVPGALVSSEWRRPDPPAAAGELGDAILASIDAAANPPTGESPIYPPPFYGAPATRAAETAASPAWQDRLNRDVAQRVAAGLGAAVVRQGQDELVDAAWRSAGDAERATTVLRQAELAVAVSRRLVQRHVAALAADGEVLSLARPLLARALVADAGSSAARSTIASALVASAMPSAALSPSLRKLARSGGAIARRAPVRAGAMLERVDVGAIQAVPPVALPDGAAGFDAISIETGQPARWRTPTAATIERERAHWQSQIGGRSRPVGGGGGIIMLRRRDDIPDIEVDNTPPVLSDETDVEVVDEFAAAARRHQGYLYQLIHPPRPRPPLGVLGDVRPLAMMRDTIVARLDAGAALIAQLGIRIVGVDADTITGFGPVVARPVLEQPLIQALARLDPDHVLPNIAAINVDRVGIAFADPEMVRAFLVGANDELGRELLWRGFPGALGHTWLRTFWGRTAAGPGGTRIPVADIDAIEAWPDAGPDLAPAQLVLVVRGELLRRYPNALVYAREAAWSGAFRVLGTGAPLVPVMAQTIANDVALFGFDLAESVARGGDTPDQPAGWYFVIEEHPSEPRFGLAAVQATTFETWRDLAWTDVVPDLVGEHLRVDGPLTQRQPVHHGEIRWGADAASLGAITFRRSNRVAMHAAMLLP